MVPKTEFSILLAGEAGQGINSIESILVRLLKQSGLHVFATKEYMSRVRGGTNSTSIRISGQRVTAPWPLGIIYREEGKPTFEDNLPLYKGDATPLYRRARNVDRVKKLLESKR